MSERKVQSSRFHDSLNYFLDYPLGRREVVERRLGKLEEVGVTLISVVAKGYRGVVFKGKTSDGSLVAIKFKRSDTVKNVIEKELQFLEFLDAFSKKVNIPNPAPKVLAADKDFIVMEFIEGEKIVDLQGERLKEALLSTVDSCYFLDLARVQHNEIKGGKHLIFSGQHVKIIDFESANFSKKTRNLFQFVGYYLVGKKLLPNLNLKEILALLQNYKKDPEKTVETLKNYLKTA
ncbi:putative serine/threonine protein kinase [Desulfurobacterium pacificum]|uniref:Serine/threonine protein kinase n=1 Tax=Desulfurobacterium pacificum TaxID=240166 RepID=A0ABY1N7K9_9BACT|nr:hypothetical protein [Desulfurobacterium pacificum]SMP02650.1 putative serine/threonine protein kinase [Desulfurobacterium pacificum]